MQLLDGGARLHLVENPASDAALAEFSCGKGKHARTVNNLIRSQIEGTAEQKANVLLLARDTAQGETLGVSAWRVDPPPWRTPGPAERHDIYIHALGRSDQFARHRLSDGNLTVGQTLMRETLKHVAAAYGGAKMPLVWGLVQRSNRPGVRLYDHFDFRARAVRRGPLARIPFWPGLGDLIYHAAPRPLADVPGCSTNDAA
jgi:ribosomal protein S18 acetylase RimI-like enzyme